MSPGLVTILAGALIRTGGRSSCRVACLRQLCLRHLRGPFLGWRFCTPRIRFGVFIRRHFMCFSLGATTSPVVPSKHFIRQPVRASITAKLDLLQILKGTFETDVCQSLTVATTPDQQVGKKHRKVLSTCELPRVGTVLPLQRLIERSPAPLKNRAESLGLPTVLTPHDSSAFSTWTVSWTLCCQLCWANPHALSGSLRPHSQSCLRTMF